MRLERAHHNQEIVIDRPYNKYRIFLSRIKKREFFVTQGLQVVYVIKGTIDLVGDGKTEKLQKGDIKILNSNTCNEFIENGEENTMLVLQVKDKYLNEFLEDDYMFLYYNEVPKRNQDKIVKLMGELYLMAFDYEWETITTDIKVKEILNLLDKRRVRKRNTIEYSNGSVEEAVYEIAKYMSSSFLSISKNNVKLSDIADQFNVNYYYLSRYFKNIIGMGYTDYLLKLKLNHAVDLLINTDKKILNISIESGFLNIKSFNVSFQKVFSITPSEFRRRFRNINKSILESDIFLEEETQKFLKDMTNSKVKYFRESIEESHGIDLNTRSLLDREKIEDIIDLNNIIDINKGFEALDTVLRSYYMKSIVVNIKILDNNIYLVDKNKGLKRLNEFELNYLINIFDKNNCKITLVLNYKVPESMKEYSIKFNEEFKDIVLAKINLISSIIGYNKLKNYVFGLNIYNVKDLLLNGHRERISSHIKTFTGLLNEKLGVGNYEWALFLNDITDLDYIYYFKKFMDSVPKPDKFVLDLKYDHIYPSYETAVEYYLNLVDEANLLLNPSGDSEIIVGFRYDMTHIPLEEKYRENYVDLFLIDLFLKFKCGGYRVVYTDYISTVDGEKRVFNKYAYNAIGIKDCSYYTSNFIRSLGKDLIEIEDGMFVTREGEDLFIFIYDNYKDYYKYTHENLTVDFDKKISYALDLNGLNGVYKIIEYTLCKWKKAFDLDEKYIISISDEDKEFLQGKMIPDIIIDFKEINENFVYKTERKILDFKFIKMHKI